MSARLLPFDRSRLEFSALEQRRQVPAVVQKFQRLDPADAVLVERIIDNFLAKAAARHAALNRL